MNDRWLACNISDQFMLALGIESWKLRRISA